MSWQKWVKGAIAAAIGGAANSVTAMVVDHSVFNFNDPSKLIQMAGGGGLISLAFYLKQSPVPTDEVEIKTTITQTTTGVAPKESSQ